MVLLAVVVVVAVVGNEFVVCDVDCECAECDAEAGERALEAVAAAEGTAVSPGLTVSYQYVATGERQEVSCESLQSSPDVRSCPWVVCGLASRRSELLRVKAGEVGSGSHCVVCVGDQSV